MNTKLNQAKRFAKSHMDFVSQKSNNHDKDKEIGDSTSLKLVLSDFFQLHPSGLPTERNAINISWKSSMCDTNGSAINLFRLAIHADVPVKLPAQILLIEILTAIFVPDNLKTLHPKTICFDLFFAGCTQLIGVILAKAIHKIFF